MVVYRGRTKSGARYTWQRAHGIESTWRKVSLRICIEWHGRNRGRKFWLAGSAELKEFSAAFRAKAAQSAVRLAFMTLTRRCLISKVLVVLLEVGLFPGSPAAPVTLAALVVRRLHRVN